MNTFIKCALVIGLASTVGCATQSTNYRYDVSYPVEINTSLPKLPGELDFAYRYAGLQFGSKIEDDAIANGFHDMDDAAIAVLKTLIPLSAETSREYGGYIYEKDDRFYFTNPPVKGSGIVVDVHQAKRLLPPGAKVVGDYHTHFKERATEAYATDDCLADHDFSAGDIAGIKNCSHKYSNYKGYLGTQAGAIQVFAPHADVTFYTAWKGDLRDEILLANRE